MNLSEEEANAELERLQQKLTLNLQEIDKNFADCNQVLTSKTIPEIEKYAEATSQIWNHCKIWLYFFRSMDLDDQRLQLQQLTQPKDTEDITNRPPHADVTGSSWNQRMNHDVTIKDITGVETRRLRRHFQQPSSTPSQGSSNRARIPTGHNKNVSEDLFLPDNADADFIKGLLWPMSSSSSSASYSNTRRLRGENGDFSPPRNTPTVPTAKMIESMSVEEASNKLLESVTRSAGLENSDDEDDNDNDFN
ncbi:MAG: DASH complex subunit Ask1-domain-containing protein [Benjaminiella poitrasii]|nr:MAG: DASH complex subunit Ask1-domain-containing protein [Benjaminiella poitrasii]